MNSKYIKIVFLVIGLFAYASNKAFAAESESKKSAQKKSTRSKSASKKRTSSDAKSSSSSSSKYVQNGVYVVPPCTNPEEIIKASELMDEVIKRLQYHATNEGYNKAAQHDQHITKQYKHYVGEEGVQKINIKIRGAEKYNDIIQMLCRTHAVVEFGDIRIKGRTILRYTPSLVMIKQRYTNLSKTERDYFHALFSKTEISPNETIIAYASADVNTESEAIQKIGEDDTSTAGDSSSNADVSQEAAIVETKKQKVANIFGFIIKKDENFINITHISSINGQAPFSHDYAIQVIRTNKLADIMRLRDT
ncbi:fam-a protein [Plasmodium vinckei brucechwatti]|uniref:Fam-a protein n=1 Tax=Plasmodium vinckei brucechwatti TaxID=119398 RepID=A0A6V7S0T7_PLAVN|nr:fam-a protein [Plasmodium vinckei brucechwatti]